MFFNFFRSPLSRCIYQHEMRKISFKSVLEFEFKENNPKPIVDLISEYKLQTHALADLYQAFRKKSWFLHYLFASHKTRINYLAEKTKILQAVNECNKKLTQLKEILLSYTLHYWSDKEKRKNYVGLLPFGSLREYYFKLSLYQNQETSADKNHSKKVKMHFRDSFIPSKIMADKLDSEYCKGLYQLDFEIPLIECNETKKKRIEAIHFHFSKLATQDYYPAYYQLAKLQQSSTDLQASLNGFETSIRYYIKAADNGFLLALIAVIDIYITQIKEIKGQLPPILEASWVTERINKYFYQCLYKFYNEEIQKKHLEIYSLTYASKNDTDTSKKKIKAIIKFSNDKLRGFFETFTQYCKDADLHRPEPNKRHVSEDNAHKI